jgi:acetyl-CoA decarbonylase/synthase complex subunit gamma
MALKALDIYKLLPKKNCKECGDPTCLTFAMKLAGGKADVDLCPYLDDTAKSVLGATTRPPIRLVKIGVGERSFAVGEEFVLYRHDKTFYHPPGILFLVSDCESREEITATTIRVRDKTFTRIGSDLQFNGIAIENTSGSPEVFSQAVAMVEENADLPLVLVAKTTEALNRALLQVGSYRPLIHAATKENFKEMCAVAKKHNCPMVVKAHGLSNLIALVKDCQAEGVKKLVMDVCPQSLGDYISSATAIRHLAITRTATDLGYPVFLDATRLSLQDAAIASGIVKYASVIITRPLSASSKAALAPPEYLYRSETHPDESPDYIV